MKHLLLLKGLDQQLKPVTIIVLHILVTTIHQFLKR